MARAADMWKAASTVTCDCKLLGASVILLDLSRRLSLPFSSHKHIINLFEHITHESGGEPKHQSNRQESAFIGEGSSSELRATIQYPSHVPDELRQSAPEHFLIVDSGATIHVLWDRTLCAYVN